MNMSTTGTVQRDDAAECREKFEVQWKREHGFRPVFDGSVYASPMAEECWYFWQAAWKAARGD
jgi:hypothetical protein